MHNLAPPPYKREPWYYDQANIPAIGRSTELYKWQETFHELKCPTLQARTLKELLTNFFSNFIPNELKTFQPQQKTWLTQPIKSFMRLKNHAWKSFVKNGRPYNKLLDI